MTHAEELSGHIQLLNKALKFYERRVADLKKLSDTQADLIDWLSDKHEGFYMSAAWLELRQRVLDTYGPTCMQCGVTKDGETIQVDHIKSKARYPHLALVFENMQVLCRPCNHAKGTNTVDYRPKGGGAK